MCINCFCLHDMFIMGHMVGTFGTVWKLSRPSGNFPDHPENIQIILKLSWLSRNFQDHPEIFQTNRKFSRLSFPDHLDNPEIFQTVWKLPSAISRVMRKNFPDGQKLSGWQCHDATMVFGPLPQYCFKSTCESCDRKNSETRPQYTSRILLLDLERALHFPLSFGISWAIFTNLFSDFVNDIVFACFRLWCHVDSHFNDFCCLYCSKNLNPKSHSWL